jgi:hypothetical protein
MGDEWKILEHDRLWDTDNDLCLCSLIFVWYKQKRKKLVVFASIYFTERGEP